VPAFRKLDAAAALMARLLPAPLEKQRTGDLRLKLQVNAVLPQASCGFPGATQVTEYITIAESRWCQQLAGLGRTLGAEMLIAFPDDDEMRHAVADFLREAQRLLGGAMLQVRKALETIRTPEAGPGRPARRTRARSPPTSGGP
jgi:hypothetical protein